MPVREAVDVLTRADLPGQIADGAAHEARAEVETEHDRGFGHRLEVDGAVARAVGALSRLADEVGLEQRLEDERDRRLRDARAPGDLRPRDRRAGADRLEHGALVQVAEQGGNRAASRHFVRDINQTARRFPGLDADDQR